MLHAVAGHRDSVNLCRSSDTTALELRGGILYRGNSAKDGHIVAQLKVGQTWIEANDERITPCAPLTHSKDAVLLFFVRNTPDVCCAHLSALL